jgi:outer membrane protein OmpA-like peptidoglycan-associated protein
MHSKRRLVKLSIAVGLMCLLAGSAIAAEINDHPLISRYPDSVPGRQDHNEFDAYPLITGVDSESWQPTGPTLEGKVTRTSYYNPSERSILEIFRNYELALAEAGFEILWSCAAAECGPSWAASAWDRFNGIKTATGGDKRYLAARLESADGEAYVAVTVNRRRHQIDVIEIAPMETGLVTVSADALAAALAARGRVEVPGIFFDTDKAMIKAESKPALDEIARLMSDQGDLAVFVVGHTDITGTLDHNMKLSRERAAAVVEALVADYGIARTRLDPHGVGPLAPATANTSEAGRAANRRVELVAR